MTSAATTDDFLSGQGVPVELADVEAELSRLWGPAAEQVGGPEVENPHVTRIALTNLVVFGHCGDSARLAGVLDTVAAQHPSRTIVLSRTDDPDPAIRAEVSALCHLPAPGLPQVCSERIVLRAGTNAAKLVPGAVRPLLEAELPFVLWWTSDPRADETLLRELGDECSRLVLDLPADAPPAAVKLGLDPSVCRFARDTAWFGLSRWRELVAQFFDPPLHHKTLDRIDSVKVDVAGPIDTTPPREAVWLVAWLAGQLDWVQVGAPTRSGGRLSASFLGPSGVVAVSIRTSLDPSLSTPEVMSTGLTTRAVGHHDSELFRLVRVAAHSPGVHVEIDSNHYCTLPRTVLAPELDQARRVSAALESSRLDPPFQKALPHALWLLGV
jgi:glucose-6-phosphate dehydrogenase assembly protein OpcA